MEAAMPVDLLRVLNATRNRVLSRIPEAFSISFPSRKRLIELE